MRADSTAMDERRVLDRLRGLEIETPSWGYGNSGTRFHVYPWPGAARTSRSGIADAALVHRLTGCCPTSRCTSRGTRSTTTASCAATRRSEGIRIGAINPNLFGDDEYRLGSLCHPDPAVRAPGARPLPRVHRDRRARSARPRSASGSRTARTTRARTTCAAATRGCVEGLEEVYAPLPAGMRLLVEYKFFEPGFYSTDLPDWGTAALVCRRLGPQAQVLVDTGHHPQGTNVEQIVALLLAEGLLGGFHFNNRKYADDDLIVGSIDPFELFRIMREIARADATPRADRVHDRPVAQRRGEDRRDDPVGREHPDRVREGAARRRGRARRRAAQGDVLGAHRVLLDGVRDRRPPAARPATRGARRSRRTRSRRSAAEGYAERLAQRARHGVASRALTSA